MNSREYFAHIATLPRRIEDVTAAIAEGGEGLRPRGEGLGPRGEPYPGFHDPTATKALSAIDRTRDLVELLDSMEAEIAEAHQLCAGVSAALGSRYGGVLERHYIDGATFDEIAGEHGVTGRTCRIWRDMACDWIDHVGMVAARHGLGDATA